MGKQLESSSAHALRARSAVTQAVSHTIECPASAKNATHRHWLTWIKRPQMINVMIIDDNEALRLGLRIFVEEESDMRVVGKCWQPAKLGHFETREIKGRIEVW